MITKNELLQLYENCGFIVTKSNLCYIIRAPDYITLTDNDKKIHEIIIGNKCQVECTINKMLLLAVKAGMIKIEN